MKKELIAPVKLKLKRANDQVNSLCNQIELWASQNKIKLKYEFLEGRLGYRIIVDDFENPAILNEWGILVGELMHNLRSALDNLAFALARIKKDPPDNPSQIFFPIFQDQEEFNKKAKTKLKNQFTPEIAHLIELLQPFQRLHEKIKDNPKTDGLIVLQWFNNIDKHRIPTVLLMVLSGEMNFSNSVAFYNDEDAELNTPPQITIFANPLKPNSVLLEHKTTKPIKEVQGKLSIEAKVFLQGPNNGEEVASLLKKIHYYTALIASQFEIYFE